MNSPESKLTSFHPAVETWFIKTFSRPTEIQIRAWPAIQARQNVLIAAPTGSGKTLAGFLAAIDELVKLGLEGNLTQQTSIVYISPLKALSNDIEKNLQRPLLGIQEELRALGLPEIPIQVRVRTGDTPTGERTAMLKNPPHILVTTPESLYLLVTSEGGRNMLKNVKTVIVDEIHAIVGSKRGSHLSLSLERLEALTGNKLVRVGISATQKPIERIADFLVGQRVSASEPKQSDCKIINVGHRREMDLTIEVPGSALSAVMGYEVWSEIYARMIQLISEHRTTLIFVNTRSLAEERLSFQLGELLGEDQVLAHHGSMSKEHRFLAEQRLKSGALRALVATASLELGIDIGSVDLVCQISSPRSIAAFLQRVGRSGHSVTGKPKGRLFPLTRDELVECTAILDAVRRGELDEIIIPEKPIDILAQQIIAEVASREYEEEELFQLVKRAYPFRDLTREEFDEVITMLADGFTTRRGRRGAYLHYDVVNKKIRARKGARLTAITSGGSIPDNFEYEVRLEPSNTYIGTLNEDFAIESSAGDIFQLGNNSWKILRVLDGVVRVADANNAPPTIPFWLGEAPGRSHELSFAVSRLREEISEQLGDLTEYSKIELSEKTEVSEETAANGEFVKAWKKSAVEWLMKDLNLPLSAADQLVTYLAAGQLALGAMPTQKQIILERFFDEAGDMHVIIHAPFGNRMNRAWGLSLRKKFCRKFNFELQAAATDDAIILSLGSTHSFPPDEVFGYLSSKTARPTLIQAVFDSPMFEIRWRWNASRSLAMLRNRNGKRVPAQLQRMNAQDLIALVFPDQLACLENIVGEREVPDHPLVEQTIEDCLTEAMDIGALEGLLQRFEAGEIVKIAIDLREPSPLSQEILNARPYAFLDDAPLEERRTRAVANRRFLDPSEAGDLGKLDEGAIDLVREQAWPDPESHDELHDALTLLGFMTGSEIEPWKSYFEELVRQNRATRVNPGNVYTPVERIPQWQVVFPNLQMTPALAIPEKLKQTEWTREKALVEIVRGRLEGLGPVTVEALAESMGTSESDVVQALIALEVEGFVFRGKFTPGTATEQWCDRRLLARIHRYTVEKLRKEIEPVSASDFMQFLFSWHRIGEGDQLSGTEALQVVLDQLEGFEAPAAAWESEILTARISDYDFLWLDLACTSGRTAWGRFRENKNHSSGPVKGTPIAFVQRVNLPIWKSMAEPEKNTPTNFPHTTGAVYETLKQRGASFFHEIIQRSGVLPSQAEDGVAELVSHGLVTADSFNGLRALLVPAKYKLASASHHRKAPFTMDQAGRWSLLHDGETSEGNTAEFLARIFLKRYGVVFRRVTEREPMSPPWRDLVRIYRRMEARGEIRGGRFVEGPSGEQFALPEAVTKLRSIRKEAQNGKLIAISASDPLNFHGILTPGDKISNLATNRVLFRHGIPVAVLESGEVKFLTKVPAEDEWIYRNALVQRNVPPKLRAYLGKGIG